MGNQVMMKETAEQDIVEWLRMAESVKDIFEDWKIYKKAADEIVRLKEAFIQERTDNIDLRHDLARANELIKQLREELASREQCGCKKRNNELNQLFSEWDYYVATLEK